MEKPDIKERAVSAGTFQRRYFEERLHDAAYWEAYFDMMAESRLNTARRDSMPIPIPALRRKY